MMPFTVKSIIVAIIIVILVMLGKKILGLRCFSTQSKSNVDIESHILLEPHNFQLKDPVSRIQHYFRNRSALNDIERSFRDFKRKDIPTKFLAQYNELVDQVKKEKYHEFEDYLSPTLFKEFKRAIKNREELPYYFEESSACQLVQARGYSESMMNVKSTNRWFQITLKYQLKDESVYHVLERNDKVKHFKFIKLFL